MKRPNNQLNCPSVLSSIQHYLQPPRELREILDSKRIPQKEFHTIKHGEVKVITKEDTKLAEARRNAVVSESAT